MAQHTAVAVTGDDLTLAEVWDVAFGRSDVALASEAEEKMHAARELLERVAHGGASEHADGVKSIPEQPTDELPLRILRSHACGVGEPYPDELVVRGFLCI